MWLRLAFDLGRVASGLFGRRVERKFKRALEEEKIYGGSIKVAGMDQENHRPTYKLSSSSHEVQSNHLLPGKSKDQP